LSLIYDKYTVDEWMEQHIEPLMKMLTSLMQRAQTLTNADIWPRRPLNFKKLSMSSKTASAAQSEEKEHDSYANVKKIHEKDNDVLLTNRGAPGMERLDDDTNKNQNGEISGKNEGNTNEDKILAHPHIEGNDKENNDLSLPS
jgi:hypothetical protein